MLRFAPEHTKMLLAYAISVKDYDFAEYLLENFRLQGLTYSQFLTKEDSG